jgi:hypothetical protein
MKQGLGKKNGIAVLLLLIGAGGGGCLQNNKLMKGVESSSSSSLVSAQALVCAEANSTYPAFVFYTSMSLCQTAWPDSPGGCSLVVINSQTCVRHSISGGGTTGGGVVLTSTSTTGGGSTTGGLSTSTTGGTGTTGGIDPPQLEWSSSPVDFGFANSYDSTSTAKTVNVVIGNSGGAASGCSFSLILPAGYASVPTNYFTILGASSCSSISALSSCLIQVKTAVPPAGTQLLGGLRVSCSGGYFKDTSTTFLKATGSYSTLFGTFYSSIGSGGICGNGLSTTATGVRLYHKTAFSSSDAVTPVLYENGSATSLVDDYAPRRVFKRTYSGSTYLWLNQGDGTFAPECKQGDPL